MLGVIRAHPLVRHLRHGRHWRIEAVKVPVQGAEVARDDFAPARDLDADPAAQGCGTELGRALERCRRAAARVAENVEPLGVLEPVQVALLSEALAAKSRRSMEQRSADGDPSCQVGASGRTRPSSDGAGLRRHTRHSGPQRLRPKGERGLVLLGRKGRACSGRTSFEVRLDLVWQLELGGRRLLELRKELAKYRLLGLRLRNVTLRGESVSC